MVFFGIFWDDILTLNLNTKKKTKNPKKNQKKTNGAQTTSFQFRMLAKAYPKKTPKKKTKKTSFQFRVLAKTNAKKKTKKNKKNQCQFGNLKKTKKKQKKQKNQCQFTDFGVATVFFLFFLGKHPPNYTSKYRAFLVSGFNFIGCFFRSDILIT